MKTNGALIIGPREPLLDSLHSNEIKFHRTICCDCPIGHISNKTTSSNIASLQNTNPITSSSPPPTHLQKHHHHSKHSNMSIDPVNGISTLFSNKMELIDDDDDDANEDGETSYINNHLSLNSSNRLLHSPSGNSTLSPTSSITSSFSRIFNKAKNNTRNSIQSINLHCEKETLNDTLLSILSDFIK